MDRIEFDDDYVRRLLAGDRQTVEEFYAYFNRMMLMALRKKLRSLDDIDDVRQETFSRVWKKLPAVRDAGALGSFVMTTCDHVRLETIRKNDRAERTDGWSETQTDPDGFLNSLIQVEDDDRVKRILARMDSRDRAILTAFFLDEMAPDEICRKFEVERQYLRVLLYRAKKKFRDLYEKRAAPPYAIALIFVTLWFMWSLWL
jgi:RNA polymerase sigma-70 factor (ECF subfamily)